VTERNAVTVHVIDDDESALKATARVLKTAGYDVRLYASAGTFLADVPDGPGCVLLDMRLPDRNGLDIQDRLNDLDCPLSIIFVTGYGDVPKSVRAMKGGAVDFLTKPVEAEVLLRAVEQALARNLQVLAVKAQRTSARTRYERLTPREREVFAHVISGQLNKQVAFDLGTTEHTIKVHRQRVMEKMRADSVADLVRLATILNVTPVGSVRDA
jgi:FixJ family two-component response regulator